MGQYSYSYYYHLDILFWVNMTRNSTDESVNMCPWQMFFLPFSAPFTLTNNLPMLYSAFFSLKSLHSGKSYTIFKQKLRVFGLASNWCNYSLCHHESKRLRGHWGHCENSHSHKFLRVFCPLVGLPFTTIITNLVSYKYLSEISLFFTKIFIVVTSSSRPFHKTFSHPYTAWLISLTTLCKGRVAI